MADSNTGIQPKVLSTLPPYSSDQTSFIKEGGLFLPSADKQLKLEMISSHPAIAAGPYDFRFSEYKHGWSCNVFNQCTTNYDSRAFVLDLGTGLKITCTGVETACANRVDPVIDWDPSKEGWYKYFTDVSDFYIGFGVKDGRDYDIQGVAKCFFNGSWIAWRWRSHAG